MELIQNNRYKNGKIYKIVCNVSGKIYIGSTCKKSLSRRLSYHRIDYKLYLKQKQHFISSYEVLENNNYSIILLEEYPCETKEQLLARERYYIENNECVNKVIPTRNKNERSKEYYQENKEKISKQHKDYYDKNKNKWSEHTKCECGGHYAKCHKQRHLRTQKHLAYLKTLKNEV
jgi:hypothetical protein